MNSFNLLVLGSKKLILKSYQRLNKINYKIDANLTSQDNYLKIVINDFIFSDAISNVD